MAADVAPGALSEYRRLSLWWDALTGPLSARPALTNDIDVDVCIVGAGFTGLWTALALALSDPALRIAVLEREVAGFGASGRNGGWCSALFATSDAGLARRHGHAAMVAMRRAMQESVDAVGQTAAAEGIDCHFAKGGSVELVRNEAQRERALAALDDARGHGFGEEDLRWLDREETAALIGATGAIGSTHTPHCAALQPTLLAWGLADAVERRGVTLYEHTEVLDIFPAPRGPAAITRGGTVRATVVVRATEAWTATLPHLRRELVPVYSLMIATEPLEETFWASAGLPRRTTFADYRHMVIYGQRTVDGRIAFGGRGAPYHYGSAVRLTTPSRVSTPCCARRSPSSSPISPVSGSPMPGVVRSASRAIGTRRSGSTAPPGWPGPGGTSATASRRPTWRAARCRTSSQASRLP